MENFLAKSDNKFLIHLGFMDEKEEPNVIPNNYYRDRPCETQGNTKTLRPVCDELEGVFI